MDSVKSKIGIGVLIAAMVILAAIIWYCILCLLEEPKTREGTFVKEPGTICESVML